MRDVVSTYTDLPLWQHQRDALALIGRYQTARKRRSGGPAALIRMPTGTGKSGVIAIAAQLLVNTKRDCLVLSPWDALVDQLRRDISERFWTRIGTDPPEKPVVRLYPSTAREELERSSKPTTWVATTATLQRLRQHSTSVYEQLASRLALVLVDEGHYEPAPQWAASIRELKRPVVLLTATPYRNDFKFFDLDPNYYFHLSHAEAERERYLRRVRFESAAFGSSTLTFCDALVDRMNDVEEEAPGSRAIVRCASKAAVQQVAAELTHRGETVVAIHERFPAGDRMLRRTVPVPNREPARFWVHQNKLTEGIDDSTFRLVAFFQPFSSERAFIQQVGRVLRNPSRKSGQHAFVLHDPRHGLEASWTAYRRYDEVDSPEELLRSPRDFATLQPSVQYITGRFRERFDLENDQIEDDFDYTLSARVYRVRKEFHLEDLTEVVNRLLEESDFEVGPMRSPASRTRLHPYIAVRNSPLLARKAFAEFEIGFTIYHQHRDLLFFYDSQRLAPPPSDVMLPIDAGVLQQLYDGTATRLTTVSLLNTDVGRNSIRRRTLRARSIADLGPDLADHAQMASTARGITGVAGSEPVDRYVGFTRSRVRDHRAGVVDFNAYITWLESIANALDDRDSARAAVFDRYAETISCPQDPTPRNILLDFPVELFHGFVGDVDQPLKLDDVCIEVANGKFTWPANDIDHEVCIAWNGKQYELECSSLDDTYTTQIAGSDRHDTLIAYLNREQAFRVLPESMHDDHCIYVGGTFVRPRLPLWGRSARFELLRILEPIEELQKIDSEKGATGSATHDGWAPASLFHLIDTLGEATDLEPHLAGVDLLVCDDMGTEIADFLALSSSSERVIALHAKASSKPTPLSAKSLHEVCSQALKNLAYLQPYFVGEPKNLAAWAGPWKADAGEVDARIRLGGPRTSEQAWSEFREALQNPATGREVWLLLGNGLSKSKLDKERTKSKPKPEVIQILFLLQATWASVSALGARLRVFCSP